MITVITGPPCAGKTTYVQQHAAYGDITVDYDKICQVLGSTDQHDHEPHVAAVARVAWAAAVAAVCADPIYRSWIIDARPSVQRLISYERAGARIVGLTASRAELHRRATITGRSADAHRRIDLFLADQPPPWKLIGTAELFGAPSGMAPRWAGGE